MKNAFAALRLPAALFLTATIVVALGACGGSPAGSPVSKSTPTSSPAPTNPSPVLTTPSASATPAQPNLIPRMSGTGTVRTFEQQGFTCNQLQPPQPLWNQYDCNKTSANSQQQETIDTIGPGDQVANLEADTLGMSPGDAATFLGAVAAMPFTGSQATQASQWVATSIPHQDSITDIGGVHYELVAGTSAAIVRLLLNNS